MQKNLVIVESPAKAKTIEKFLGKDYKVMSSYGHIRDLKKKNFGVDLETFEPQYEIPEEKKRVVSELRSQAKKSEVIWLASDEDREGEAISWHLAEVLGLNPKETRRIVFHEITKPAILAAIEHPRHINLNLVDAQQARRVLDRIVGFKLSPVLWKKVRPNLSAGRVQSVAVRLIVDKEREIAKFRSEDSYKVTALFIVNDCQEKQYLKAELNKRFETEEEATAFLKGCANAEFKVESISTKPARRQPAPPFTTSTLQQEAARKLGFSVATTMRVAQALYESGIITYMRTDSVNLSGLCLNACQKVIEERPGAQYHQRRMFHTHSKGAQEAHEAIRPTNMDCRTISGTAQEKRLYELIWKRTLACQMADAKLERTQVNIGISNREEAFVAMGEVVKFDGFLRVYRESRGDEEEKGEESRLLPKVYEGQILPREEIQAVQRFSLRPLRYTEASLVHKLEELGIGRPSTYAPTISTIQQREYVNRGDKEGESRSYVEISMDNRGLRRELKTEVVGAEKGKLLPTDIGIVVNDFLLQYFPEILDYGFTANVEKDFDEVAEGRKDWAKLISAFYADFSPKVEQSLHEKTEHRIGERILGNDPQSGRQVSVKIGRFGPLAQIGSNAESEKPRFVSIPSNLSLEKITLEEVLELFQMPKTLGEFEGLPVIVNTGRFGPYVLHNKKYASIPKGEEPANMTLERAINIILLKRESEEKSHLKRFEEEPELEIRVGRWGPYISFKGTNYRIPKKDAVRAAELSLKDCMKFVEVEQKKRLKTKRVK